MRKFFERFTCDRCNGAVEVEVREGHRAKLPERWIGLYQSGSGVSYTFCSVDCLKAQVVTFKGESE